MGWWLRSARALLVATVAATLGAAALQQVTLLNGTKDFGRVRPGSTHTAQFALHNAGTAPVTVRAAVPSCKCTDVGLVAGTVIPAGGSIPFSATLAVPTTPGEKDAKIQIVLDDGSAPLVAQMKAVASLPVEATPAFVDALKGKSTGIVTLRSEDGKPFRVLSADGRPPVCVGFDPAKDQPRAEYTLQWEFSAPASGDPRLWWIVATDREDAPLVALRVRHELTGSKADAARFDRHWWAPEQLVLANRVKAGAPVTLTLDLEHYNPSARGAVQRPEWSAVQSVRSMTPFASAALVSNAPAGDHSSVTFSFTPATGTKGFLFAPVEITTPTGSGVVPVVALVTD